MTAGSPFRINWRDLDAVIAYAKKLGHGTIVYKHPDRDNYNITHLSTFMKGVKAGADYDEQWIVFKY